MIKLKIPKNISVVVYSCKGLKPKRNDHCKYCVVFGVGGKKFKTDVVEDFHGSPSFNTDAEIPISNPDVELKFKVIEKTSGDVLGKLVVPMLDLPFVEEDGLFTVKLKDVGRSGEGAGEIVFKAWINAHKVLQDDALNSDNTHRKSTLSIGISKLKDKLTLKRNDSNPNLLNRRQTISKEQELGSIVSPRPSLLKLTKASSSCNDLVALSLSSSSHQVLESDRLEDGRGVMEALTPEVSGVSPKEGSVNGGTRLVLRGRNLGARKEDVVGLFVGGSNLLSTLEYFSPSKIACVTKPWKAVEGSITIETQSGGKGICLVKYTYLQPVAVFEDEEDKKSSIGWSLRRGSWGSGGKKGSLGGGSVSGGSELSVVSTPSMKLKFKNKPPTQQEPEPPSQPHKTPSSSNITPTGDIFTPPEVTGVSPNEGGYNETTKVVIRGSHLGLDADDLLKIMVCGKDYRHTLEWESPSKMVCHVGPVIKPTRGEIVVETVSGGVGFSMVEFKLVDYRKERDAEINRLMKKKLVKRASLEQDQLLQHLQELQVHTTKGDNNTQKENLNDDGKEKLNLDSDEKVNLGIEKGKVDKDNESGGFTNGGFGGGGVDSGSSGGGGVVDSGSRGGVVDSGSSGRRDSGAFSGSVGGVDDTKLMSSSNLPTIIPTIPITSTKDQTGTSNGGYSGNNNEGYSGNSISRNSGNRSSYSGNGFNVNTVKPANNRPPVVEIQPMVHKSRKDQEMEELLFIMESKLKLRDMEIEKLTDSNRVLKDECKRLKTYMEELLSKAMDLCPAILAVNQ